MITNIDPSWLMVVSWIQGGITAYCASRRGRSPYVWFAVGMLLGLFGLLAVFLLPKRQQGQHKMAADKTVVVKDVVPAAHPVVDLTEQYRSKDWFYVDGEHARQGPVAFVDLCRRWHDGDIGGCTYVWSDGMAQWSLISDDDGLRGALEQ